MFHGNHMKLSFDLNNSGISLGFGESKRTLRVRNLNADQDYPRRSYIYAHFDQQAVPFYIGKGVGRRAWTDDRHPLWHWYVEKHLQGQYSVVILEDDLTPDQAEEFENAWISQESETLVNWINLSRPTDFKASARYHELRNANLALFAEAKGKEKNDLEGAVLLYQRALQGISDYASIQPDLGLVGKLLSEETTELGLRGELQVLDRLTLCLVRLGRCAEAKASMTEYFVAYRRDLHLSGAQQIQKRVAKATNESRAAP